MMKLTLIVIPLFLIFCIPCSFSWEITTSPSPSPVSVLDPTPSSEPITAQLTPTPKVTNKLSTSPERTEEETEAWETNPLLTNLNGGEREIIPRLRRLRQRVVDNGCVVNLCFALQGNDFVSDADWENQKNLVDLMISILHTDEYGNYCAVQYGSTTRPISTLTRDKELFLSRLRGTERLGGFDSNIFASLAYISFQLRQKYIDANKAILVGNALGSLSSTSTLNASQIRSLVDNIDMCAIGIGSSSLSSVTQFADPNKIFVAQDFFQLAEVVSGLVSDVCGFSL